MARRETIGQRTKRLRLEPGPSQRELISTRNLVRPHLAGRGGRSNAVGQGVAANREQARRNGRAPAEGSADADGTGRCGRRSRRPGPAARHSAFAYDQNERPRPAGAAPLLPRQGKRRIGRRWTPPLAQNEHRVRHSGRGRSFGDAAITTAPTTRAPTTASGQTRPRWARPGEPPGARSSPNPRLTRKRAGSTACICSRHGPAAPAA